MKQRANFALHVVPHIKLNCFRAIWSLFLVKCEKNVHPTLLNLYNVKKKNLCICFPGPEHLLEGIPGAERPEAESRAGD